MQERTSSADVSVEDFSSPTRSSLQLNLTATNAVLGEEIVQVDGGKEFFPHLLATSIGSTWTHVTISIDSSKRTVSVTVNGATSLMASSFNAAFIFGPVAINVGTPTRRAHRPAAPCTSTTSSRTSNKRQFPTKRVSRP